MEDEKSRVGEVDGKWKKEQGRSEKVEKRKVNYAKVAAGKAK